MLSSVSQMRHKPFNAARPWAVLLAGVVTAGCCHTNVDLNPNVSHREIRSVAVVDFEENVGRTDAGWFHGSVAPQESGRQVASLVSAVLSRQKCYLVVTARESRQKLGTCAAGVGGENGKQSVQKAASLLGVDAIVSGRVDVYRLTYRFFCQRSEVRCVFWCTEAQTGERCWTIKIDRSCWFGHERDLAKSEIEQGVTRLCGELAKIQPIRGLPKGASRRR